MKIGVYPGSFDPVTKGHEDIIDRSVRLFDKVIVAALKNNKKDYLFTDEERVEMLKNSTKRYKTVEVMSFDGMLVELVKKYNANAIIRGLRDVTDFQYELQLSQVNKILADEIDTIFFTTNLSYVQVSSSVVKEIASYGGDVSSFVDEEVADRLYKKFGVKYVK